MFHRDVEAKLVGKALKDFDQPRPWSSLDLGCGDYPRNPFGADHSFGCDIRENLDKNVISCNLVLEPIPKPDCSMDFITAYEFIEHMPRFLAGPQTRFPFIELMSDIHRTLKPGGLLLASTPAYPSQEVFQDPTHVNFITNNTFPYYFCWHPYGGPWGRIYGFKGVFQLLQQRRRGINLLTIMKKMA